MPDFILIAHPNSQFGFMDNAAAEMAAGYRALGYRAISTHAQDQVRMDEAFSIIERDGISMIVLVNGALLEFADGPIGELFDALKIPVFGFFIDHPAYHLGRLAARLERLIVSTPSRNNGDFIKRFIRDDLPVKWIGHGASPAIPGLARPWDERDIEVLVPSSLSGGPEVDRAGWGSRYGNMMTAQLNAIVEVHDAAPTQPLHEAIVHVLGDRPVSLDEISPYFWAVDGYLRRRIKLDSVRALVDEGVPVTVCGPNWPELGRSATVIPGVPLADAWALMGRAKMVLNHLPLYYDSHERPLQAAIYGALPASTSSDWLDQAMAGHALMLPLCVRDAAAAIAAALMDPELAEKAARGRAAVESGQMWTHRAAELAAYAGLRALNA